MTTIAFCGLGQMGRRMAARLLSAGHQVTVWNRSPGPQEELARLGAAEADSPEATASSSEITITMVTGPEALEEVVLGPHGVAAGLPAGGLLVDMSTVGTDTFRSVAARLPAGRSAADAPVRGSIAEAEAGTLQIYVGAEPADYERLAPVLATLGEVRHVGPPGAGASTKLVVNTALIASMALVGEALALGEALGLDRDTLLDVLAKSPLAPTVAAKRDNLARGHYPPAFPLRLADKDIHLVLGAARRLGLDMKLAEAAARWMDTALAGADADVDFSAVVATVAGEAPQP